MQTNNKHLNSESINSLNLSARSINTKSIETDSTITKDIRILNELNVKGEKDGEQLQSVNYNGLIGILINEIKNLKIRVNELEEKQKS